MELPREAARRANWDALEGLHLCEAVASSFLRCTRATHLSWTGGPKSRTRRPKAAQQHVALDEALATLGTSQVNVESLRV